MHARRVATGLAGFTLTLLLLIAVLGFSGTATYLLPWLATLGLALAATAAVMLQRHIFTPLRTLQAELAQAAAQRSLAPPTLATAEGEIQSIATSVGDLIAQMRSAFDELRQCADELLSVSEEVDVASRKISRNSRLQSEASTHMAAAVEEMTVSISLAADQAVTASTHTQDSAGVARDSAADILSTVEGIHAISRLMTEATAHIRALREDCDSITGMAATIHDIADQTNLLALNAAIEAARAGEQGRGFAVVADEVRKLAERTARSTQEISALVQRMLTDARQAVDDMDNTEQVVARGVASASRAGSSVEHIQSGSSTAAIVVQDISDAIQEQSKASTEVAKNIEQVAQMSEQNSLATQAAAEAINRLTHSSRRIGQILTRFHQGTDKGQRLILRLADIHAEDHPAVRALLAMSQTLHERSQGRIELKVHAGGVLGTEKEVSEQVRGGTIDMMRVNLSSLNKDCPLTVVPTLPFLFRNTEHLHAAMDGAPGAAILSACEAAGLIGLVFFDSGARSIYATKPVRSLADTRDMKLRVMQSDLWVAVAKAMGAVPTPMPMDEIIPGFKTGLIDAAENNIPTFDSYRQHEAFKYFSHTEHAMVPEIIVFSRERWQSLSAEDQQLIRDAARDAVPVMRKYWQEREVQARQHAMQAGTHFVTDVDKAAFQRAMQPVYERFVISPEQRALLRAIQDIR